MSNKQYKSSLKELRNENYNDLNYYKLWKSLRKIRLQISLEDEETIRKIVKKYIS